MLKVEPGRLTGVIGPNGAGKKYSDQSDARLDSGQ